MRQRVRWYRFDEVVVQEERRALVDVLHDECVVGRIEVVEVCEELVVCGFVLDGGDGGGNVSVVEGVTGNGLIPVFGPSNGTKQPDRLSWV